MAPRTAVLPLFALSLSLLLAGCTGTDQVAPTTPGASAVTPTPSPSAPAEQPGVFDGDCAAVAAVITATDVLGEGFLPRSEALAQQNPDFATAWREQPDLRPEQTAGGIFCDLLAPNASTGGIASTVRVQVLPAASVPHPVVKDGCDYVPGGEGNVACLIAEVSGEWWIALRSDLHADSVPDAVPAELRAAVAGLTKALQAEDAPVSISRAGWWPLPECDALAGTMGSAPSAAPLDDPSDVRDEVLRDAGIAATCVFGDSGGQRQIEIAPGAGVRWSDISSRTPAQSTEVAGAGDAFASELDLPSGRAHFLVTRSGDNVLLVRTESASTSMTIAQDLLGTFG